MPKFHPEIQIVCLRCTDGEVGAMSALTPQICPLVKLTIQNRQALIERVPSASALTIRTLKEPPQDGKKPKKKKKIKIKQVEISLLMRLSTLPERCDRSFAGELSGTIKEILGSAQSVGGGVDGHHPLDIMDDISSDAVGCPASQELRREVFP
ncbi:60S ribosomal protein L12 [Myotis brandtii]|uniref:Large ribosomal subunit protein uL11 n=1 Tax=Myotis brandtii TaxID=109478 RepID=S7PKX3_MYOBR|nr:60S ribosomal protein L12 [Myotis brandtii]